MDKIVFDSRWNGEHGIGRFSREVYEGLDIFEPITLSGHPASPLDCIKLTAYLTKEKRLFLTPGYNAPLLFLSRVMITVHDLNHIDIDSNASFLKNIYYNFILKRACRKSLRIFTVSEFSKKRICDWSGVNPNNVIVVGNGVSTEFSEKGDSFQSTKPYILTVGNRKAHKNETLAINAYAKSNLVETHDYYFSGEPSQELKNVILELNIESKVKFLGRLSDSKLAQLYRGATFLLFPSLYEGFGLPVIEAMSCGLPVITSNNTSLKEIAGNSAVLVDPNKIEEVTNAINELGVNLELRSKLIKLGFEQALKYSWSTTVTKIFDELKKL